MERPDTAQALAGGPDTGSGGGQGPGRGDGRAAHSQAANLATGSASLIVQAHLVLPSSERGSLYNMFEALQVTPEGATLRGGLLLEVNEEVTIELRLPDLSSFRARARVVQVMLGERPAMKVVWTGVGDADRRRLSGQ